MIGRIVTAIACLALAVVLAGCPSDSGRRGSGQLRRIDIVGAQALMVAPANQVARAGRVGIEAHGAGNVLFKQVGGEWMRVRMMDEYGHEVQTEAPLLIDDMTDRWMAMVFSGGEPSLSVLMTRPVFLVCKQTGAAFDITEVGFPHRHTSVFECQPHVGVDGNGNLYFRGADGMRVLKISLGPTHGTAVPITPPGLNVFQFAVCNAGNILYQATADGGFFHFSLITASGTLIPLGTDMAGFIFTGLDGEIYRLDWDNHRLYRLEVTGNTLADVNFHPIYVDGLDEIDITPVGLFHLPGEMFIFAQSGAGMLFLPQNGTPRLVNVQATNGGFPTSHGPERMSVSSNYLFVNDVNMGVVAINLETGATRIEVPRSDFVIIRSLTVTHAGVIIVDALTFHGNRTLIQIFPDGRRETIIEDVAEDQIITLTRVR